MEEILEKRKLVKEYSEPTTLWHLALDWSRKNIMFVWDILIKQFLEVVKEFFRRQITTN